MESFIAGHTSCVCLLGLPVGHSISPQIHNHVFRKYKLPYVYIPLPVSPRGLAAAVYTVRESCAGANVTIPHKEAAAHYCDELSALSSVTGTVNTLYLKDGRLCGTTTDPVGFYKALEASGHVLGDDNVVILGSGGTARTLGAALLLDKKCRSVVFAARSEKKAAALASQLEKIGNVPVGYCTLGSSESARFFNRCTLLVNCTSVGMYPYTDETPLNAEFLHSGMTVFDVIYNPCTTRFLKEAALIGCKTQNGLLMLLHQGLESLRYWTGVSVSDNIFNIAQLQALVNEKRDS
ncbi:MAG: shikimate dehydrogenase [Chitinispirillales bacterium]|jgi:shikimate dehydrogenase|nr:shikimate dehydrogenase [Chitinispirillales bacterium]